MDDLLGKLSIVTGSAMGIGKEVALRLARDGSDIAVVDIEKEGAQKTVEEIRAMGRKSLFFGVDVARWDQVKAMVDEILKNFNKVDILVNNAGILGPVAGVWEYRVEDWDRVMDSWKRRQSKHERLQYFQGRRHRFHEIPRQGGRSTEHHR